MSIKEEYLIVDRGDTTYVGELGHGINPTVSIHVAIWCVINCTVQWDVVMDILGVILGLANNYGSHEAFPISYCEYK